MDSKQQLKNIVEMYIDLLSSNKKEMASNLIEGGRVGPVSSELELYGFSMEKYRHVKVVSVGDAFNGKTISIETIVRVVPESFGPAVANKEDINERGL